MVSAPLNVFQRCAHRASKDLASIIRVNHAGELGADRIYAGQMAVLGNTNMGKEIQHMWDQEKKHKAKFEELINKYRVRPTAFVPIWNVAGFMLGAGKKILFLSFYVFLCKVTLLIHRCVRKVWFLNLSALQEQLS